MAWTEEDYLDNARHSLSVVRSLLRDSGIGFPSELAELQMLEDRLRLRQETLAKERIAKEG